MSLFIKQEMIHQLIELADLYDHEGAVCADAGAFQAAAVMFAIAFEARLFCTVAMSEHVLEPDGKWPDGDPFKWELGRMVRAAKDAGWFGSGSVLEEAVSAINEVRISAVHPAAYIRDGAKFITEPELKSIFNVLDAANGELGRILRELPNPPNDDHT